MDSDFLYEYWEWNVIIPTDELQHVSEGWRKNTKQIIMGTWLVG
jgi:hypothetical protein